MNIQSITAQQNSSQASITEIVLPGSSPNNNEIILPMLAHLSRHTGSRWFSWIISDTDEQKTIINKTTLAYYGFDIAKVRIIYAKNNLEAFRILWGSLQIGTSDTVVASPALTKDYDVRSLEQAAIKGNSRGLMLRYR